MAIDYENEAKEIREYLHKIPEVGYNEFKTQEFIIAYLEKIGLKPQKAAITGVVCFIDFGKEETYAFRADMDGLPIFEEAESEFKSENEGFMHACGHDGHMAMLLTFANMLANGDIQAKANALLIFQPAEEGPGGAEAILKEGHFEKHSVKKAFGIHVYPGGPFGAIMSKAGDFFASSVELYFDIAGKSSHGAQPQYGKDALLAVANLVIQLSGVVGKAVSPLEGAVIMLGKMNSGERLNVVASSAHLEGSLRVFSPQAKKTVIERINGVASGVGQSFGVECNFRPVYFYPTLENDEALYHESIKKAPYIQEAQKQMLSEDFAYYAQKIPSVFFLLGTDDGDESHQNALHSSRFAFNSKALAYGIRLYVDLISY